MSIDLATLMVETATRVVITRNESGDRNYQTTSSEACLFRDITSLTETGNRELVGIDGILWFGPGSPAVVGDIYYHPLEGYLEIRSRIRAKRLVIDNTTQFIKCGIKRTRQVS